MAKKNKIPKKGKMIIRVERNSEQFKTTIESKQVSTEEMFAISRMIRERAEKQMVMDAVEDLGFTFKGE